jgi:hypothetical protein
VEKWVPFYQAMATGVLRQTLRSQMEKKPPDTRPAAFSVMRRKQRTRA